MKRILYLILLAMVVSSIAAWNVKEKYVGPKTPVSDTSWHRDILPGYEARYVNQGESFDGPCRSTIVRSLRNGRSGKAFLYIHGFNDYFFQSEMGREFVDSGYSFYAVDLRRYGRSREPWQYPFNIRDMKEYFNDIDSALVQIRRDGNTDITLGGHSTGGLTVILYAVSKGSSIGFDRVVTDSPFLAWNFNAFYRKVLIPSVSAFGGMLPDVRIPQGKCDGYAWSLLKEFHGEWDYDTDWKMIFSPPVTLSWIRSIQKAQREVVKKGKTLSVPLLVMHSSRKIDGCAWTPDFQTGDAVLNPEAIGERAVRIREKSLVPVEICTIDSGLHDLILSRPDVRRAAYDSIFSFIRRHSHGHFRLF